MNFSHGDGLKTSIIEQGIEIYSGIGLQFTTPSGIIDCRTSFSRRIAHHAVGMMKRHIHHAGITLTHRIDNIVLGVKVVEVHFVIATLQTKIVPKKIYLVISRENSKLQCRDTSPSLGTYTGKMELQRTIAICLLTQMYACGYIPDILF